MITYHATTPHIKRLLNTRKREFGLYQIPTSGRDQPINTASYWDGGSRDEWAIRDLAFNITGYPPSGKFPDFTAKYLLPLSSLLTKHGVFMGKPATVIVYFHEIDKAAVYQSLNLST